MWGHLLDPDVLVKAVASGRQKGEQPDVAARRAALRRPQGRAAPADHDVRPDPGVHRQPRGGRRGPRRRRRAARRAVRQLARRHHHARRHQVRVTKKLEAVVHTTDRARPRSRSSATTTATRPGCCPRTTRSSRRSASPTRPAGSSRAGRRSTARSRSSCGCSTASITDAIDKGHLRRPTAEDPLRIVDLGCGNAYLTFAAQRFLTDVRELPVRLTGVDVKEQSREHNSAVAAELGVDAEFVVGTIGGVDARPGARGGARPARLRHRDRRGAGPGGRVGRPAGARRALLPPRHRRPAAQGADPVAVRHAHPARHPPRAARRHPDRRAAGLADAAAGLPGRRRAVRREPAHAAQHHAARGPHRRPGQGRLGAQGVRRAGRPPGASSPQLAELLERLMLDRVRRRWLVAGAVRARRRRRRRRTPAPRSVFTLPGPGDRRVQRAGGRATGCS